MKCGCVQIQCVGGLGWGHSADANVSISRSNYVNLEWKNETISKQ